MISSTIALPFSLVVTNYKNWDLTLQCIDKHLALENLAEIIIVDDCSDLPFPSISDPRIKIVKNEKNLGFVKSVNVGIRHATSEIVLLFDSDAYPLEGYSSVVSDRFEKNPKLAALGFVTYDEAGNQTASYETEPGVMSIILGQAIYFKLHNPNRYAATNLVVYSCAVALRKKAFLLDGGFDENIDWMDPDVDKCISLRRQGWKIDADHRLKAFHKGGAVPQLTSQRVIRQYKSRWYVLSKHGKIPMKPLSRAILLGRLYFEYLFLRMFAPRLYPPEIAQDKIKGRKELINNSRTYFS